MSLRVETVIQDLVERLQSYESLAGLPSSELSWLAGRGAVSCYEEGEIVAPSGERIDFMWICLKGGIAIDVDRGAGPRRAMEWRAGDVSGLLPYSRMARTPGTAYALELTEALTVSREHFPELIQECPNFAAHTVHLMIDRARTFSAGDLHDEKMISMGRLAAGLAHELNNPASATVRSAQLLASEILETDRAARELGATGLTPDHMAEVERVREICLATPVEPALTLSQRADREEEILGWLEGKGADPVHAAALADTPVTIETLNLLAQELPTASLGAALDWVATGCTTRALAEDIERSARRIHDLVSAVKRFSYMDRPSRTELVDVKEGLLDTIAVVGAKARAKSAEIRVDVEEGLPPVEGTGGELNQVWLNLIDNALDAVTESGRVQVSACAELDRVVVRVVDDGHGVPPDLLAKIFDPFFTTKEPGEGTGLGLDIARSIARRHSGDIEVESIPGRTEFRVRIPAAGA